MIFRISDAQLTAFYNLNCVSIFIHISRRFTEGNISQYLFLFANARLSRARETLRKCSITHCIITHGMTYMHLSCTCTVGLLLGSVVRNARVVRSVLGRHYSTVTIRIMIIRMTIRADLRGFILDQEAARAKCQILSSIFT